MDLTRLSMSRIVHGRLRVWSGRGFIPTGLIGRAVGLRRNVIVVTELVLRRRTRQLLLLLLLLLRSWVEGSLTIL